MFRGKMTIYVAVRLVSYPGEGHGNPFGFQVPYRSYRFSKRNSVIKV